MWTSQIQVHDTRDMKRKLNTFLLLINSFCKDNDYFSTYKRVSNFPSPLNGKNIKHHISQPPPWSDILHMWVN